MSNRIARHFWHVAAIVLLGQSWNGTAAQSVGYSPVPRGIVESRVVKYAGDNRQREATLKQLFADAGCDDQHLSEQLVKGSKLPNVICVLPGASDRAIIVGAHFDRVSEGDGVVDNWSGASLLPSLYEATKTNTRKHTYIFIGFTDEEKGEVGSHFYARQMTKEQVAATDAMVNMDTLGLGPTEVWAGHSDKNLTNILGYVARQLKLPVTAISVEHAGADSEQFEARRIPSITIHSVTQATIDILHTSKDKMSAMRLDDYYDTYRLLAAYVARLDQNNGAPR